MIDLERHDESWWRQATFEGKSVAAALRARDMSLLFRFLRSRGYSRSRLAGCTGLAETRVRAISNGTQQVTAYEVLERIAEGLGIPRHMMGLAYEDVPASLDKSHDDGPSLFAEDVPTVVTVDEIEQIISLASLLTSWDFAHGGGVARQVAEAHLRWAARLLRQRCADGLAADLFAAVARLGAVAGFMNFDANNQSQAQKIFEFSSECAVTAGDLHLQAKLLSHRARQAIWCGSPADGIKLLDRALDFGGLTPAEQAMLHTGRARALARMGLRAETVAAVAAADRAFERVGAVPERPWMKYYDQAQHLGDTGHALFGMAMNGHATSEAIDRLYAAVNGHGDGYARSTAQSAIKLASLLMSTGDPAQASDLGLRTIRRLEGLQSARVIEGLRELVRVSGQHRSVPAVVELREAIFEATYV
jgi:transcriptional regulator with XRE-family HTH domain